MSEMRDMFVATAERLFQDHCTAERLRAASNGSLDAHLWATLTDAGLTKAIVPEDAGGSGAEPADALAILIPAGRFSLPAPLAETMLAGWLLGRAGIVVPDEPLTIAVPRAGENLTASRSDGGWRITGKVARVPWASACGGIAALAQGPDGPVLALVAPGDCHIAPAANLAGEPRDDVSFDAATAPTAAAAPLAREQVFALGAMARSAQMAGALQNVLQLSVQYAQDRTQFGKQLGKFQAIQQNLAFMAGQAAAATAAADAAIEAAGNDIDGPAIAAAKVRTGEAASISASIAHQVHGAIGFTREHALHHSTQRLWAWRDEFGNEAFWSRQLGDRALRAGADGLWAMITAA